MMIRTKGIVRATVAASLLLGASYASAHVGEHLYSNASAKIVTLKPADYKAELKSLISQGYDIAGVDVEAGTIDVVVSDNQLAKWDMKKWEIDRCGQWGWQRRDE